MKCLIKTERLFIRLAEPEDAENIFLTVLILLKISSRDGFLIRLKKSVTT